MKSSTVVSVLLLLGAGLAFLLGRASAPMVPSLTAQGRGSRPRRPPVTAPRSKTPEPLLLETDSGQAGASNGFIAVTGSYGVGTSVLYVLDTVHRQIAVYEARGGSPGSRRLVLVGARRIELDLQLEGYNDESEYDYGQLRRMFATRGDAKKARPAPAKSSRTERRK